MAKNEAALGDMMVPDEYNPLSLMKMANLYGLFPEGVRNILEGRIDKNPELALRDLADRLPDAGEDPAKLLESVGPHVPAGLVGMIAGRGAKTADLAMMQRAEEMLAAGVSPREVRAATWDGNPMHSGWFRGPDGKMRFEINDSTSVLDGNKLYKRYQSKPVREVLDHPAAQAAYPELFGKGVQSANFEPNLLGSYHPGTGETLLNYERLLADPQGTKSTLLHEIQHAIQTQEGFAGGNNPGRVMTELTDMERTERGPLTPLISKYKDSTSRYRDLSDISPALDDARQVMLLDKDMTRAYDEFLPGQDIDMDYLIGLRQKIDAGARGGENGDIYSRLVEAGKPFDAKMLLADRDLKRQALMAQQAKDREMLQQMTDYDDWLQAKYRFAQGDKGMKLKGSSGSYNAYQKTGGEAESRLVQDRMNLTPEQMRATSLDYDVLPAYQIGLGRRPASRFVDEMLEKYQSLPDPVKGYADGGLVNDDGSGYDLSGVNVLLESLMEEPNG